VLEHELLRFGYLVVFFGSMVEGEVVLLAAAFLAHRGYLDLPLVVLAAAAGNTVADQVYYQIARARGRAAFERKAAEDARYRRIHDWIARRGPVLLFVSRFLYGLRIAIPAACGASGMRAPLFLAVNALGGLFWAAVIGLGGYAFGGTLELLLADVRRVEGAALAVLVLLAVAWLVRRRDLGDLVALLRPRGERLARLATVAQSALGDLGRGLLTRPHVRLAALTVLLGALNLASALFTWRFVNIAELEAWLPLEVTHGSRTLMAFAGFLLVLLGRGLARRKHVAWWAAMAVAFLSVPLHIGNGAGVVRAGLAAVLGVELWRHRRRFLARSEVAGLRRAAAVGVLAACLITAFGLTMWHDMFPGAYSAADAVAATWQAATFQDVVGPVLPGVGRFAWSLQVLLILSSLTVIGFLFSPVVARAEPWDTAERARAIAWEHGADSLSYFAKQDDKIHFIVNGQALVAYRLAARVAVVVGDPVGPEALVPDAIRTFVDVCARNDWVPVFYETSARWLAVYRREGLRSFKIGEEAIIRPAGFTLQGSRIANVRHTIAKLKRDHPGLQAREYRRESADAETDAQLEEVSAEWLEGKSGGEMGFNLGVFAVEELADKRTFIAVDGTGRVSAFVTWLPYRAGRAFVLDAMRRRRDAPSGVMELLIAQAAMTFKEEGVEQMSLATAPLANAGETGAASPYDRGVRLIFAHLSSVYGYRSLFFFKKKFDPAWESRYLVFPRPDLLPRVAFALIRVHTSGRLIDWLRPRTTPPSGQSTPAQAAA
jgi:phosphatidylglycerol lysyltransferase